MFDRKIKIEQKQIPKYILTEDENYHGTQHIKKRFLVFRCADIYFLKHRSQKALKKLYTSVILLINQSNEIGEK